MSGGKRVWRQPTDALSACAAGIAGMAVLWVVCGMTGWQLVRKVCVTPTWASASCCCCRALLRMWLLLVYTSGGPFSFSPCLTAIFAGRRSARPRLCHGAWVL